MTPLIDLAFVLLIIFMITTPLLEQTIPIHLPLENQKAQPSEEDIEFQTIAIDKQGQLFWGKEAVSLATLDRYLENVSNRRNQPVISIRADREVPYQKVIHVIDQVKKNDLTRIDLDTQVR